MSENLLTEERPNGSPRHPVILGDVFADMDNFHKKYGFTHDKLSGTGIVNRLQFLKEELDETVLAAHQMDAEEVVDGLIDLIVVAAGTLNLMIGPQKSASAWIKVMSANHQKDLGFNAKRPNSDGMDLVKPEGWTAPDLIPEAIPLAETFDFIEDRPKTLNEYRALLEEAFNLNEPVNDERGAVKVLREAIDLMKRKGSDYNAHVKNSEYYPNGIDDLVYMIDTVKRLRQVSIIEKLREGQNIEFEGLRDTVMDRIVYLSFLAEWINYEMDGQDVERDLFNKERSDAE